MPQKRRKNSLIRSVLLPVELIERVNSEIDSQHRNGRFAPLTWSEYLRRAIERDLDHGRRARRTRKRKRKE